MKLTDNSLWPSSSGMPDVDPLEIIGEEKMNNFALMPLAIYSIRRKIRSVVVLLKSVLQL